MFEDISKFESQVEKIGKCISEESFKEQFSNNLFIKNERGEITYVKASPEKLTSDVPVFYIGGFSQGKETYMDELKDLAESGREVLFANPIKGFSVSEQDSYRVFKEKYNLPDVLLSKMAAIEEVIREEEMIDADLVGHSQGGIIASLLCAKYPTLVNNLVLLSTAGFSPGDTTPELFTKFSKQLASNLTRNKSEKLKQAMKRAGTSFVKEALSSEIDDRILKTILWRLRVEVPGISAVDLAPILRDIKERAEFDETIHTEITLVSAVKDELFKTETYEAKLGSEPDRYIDNWAFFADKEASHTAAGIEQAGLLRQILNK